jgi:hypothetical protein
MSSDVKQRSRFVRAMILLTYCAAAISICSWAYFHSRPVLIWAWGYDKSYRFEPLTQISDPGSFFSGSINYKYFTLNWDGERIFVQGSALTELSYAPPGAFIIAALPNGLGLAWRQRASPDNKMTRPLVVPYWCFALPAVFPTLSVLRSRCRRRRYTTLGQCVYCGYDLTGNASEVCPECGQRVWTPGVIGTVWRWGSQE